MIMLFVTCVHFAITKSKSLKSYQIGRMGVELSKPYFMILEECCTNVFHKLFFLGELFLSINGSKRMFYSIENVLKLES